MTQFQIFIRSFRVFRAQHEKEVKNEIAMFNYETNSFVEFKAYFEKVYGLENYKEFSKMINTKPNSRMDELELLFKLELNRWSFILNDNKIVPIEMEIFESKLNRKQFYSFIYLNEFDFIRLNDAKFVFDFYDLNQDSIIDYNEFIEGLKGNLNIAF